MGDASVPTPLDLGARVDRDGGVRFRVWAPKCRRVDVVRGGATVPLVRGATGLFDGTAKDARAGERYRLRLDGTAPDVPDPASRFQPDGPGGPSEIIDPSAFAWTDARWRGVELRGQVIYELHVGTFTKEGTYRAAIHELAALRDVGVTSIELMPVAEFPGRFGWGYDGVFLYAPFHGYGRPDDLRALVDAAHAHGLGVLLDVVYNHFGPAGCDHERFSAHFFSDAVGEWGRAIDYETERGVRAYFVENAAHWVREYHLDGLRLDATQCMYDRSEEHVIASIAEAARAAAGSRNILVVAENEPQHANLVRPRAQGGYGLSAVWNDDFHHAAITALTGRREAYYGNTSGTPQELVSALKWGYLFQGQYYPWQQKMRGKPALDLPPEAFVLFLENHDQVANTATGERPTARCTAAAYRAMTTAMLLSPGTPLLFQGEELAVATPFRYFADHDPPLASLVSEGRHASLRQFPSIADPAADSLYVAPNDPRAFESSKLDLSVRTQEPHAKAFELHKALLRLRREDPVFSAQRSDWMHGAVLSGRAFALRFVTGAAVRVEEGAATPLSDRLVLVNLGSDLDLTTVAEPLLAPPEGARFTPVLSTEDPRFGGTGQPPMRDHDRITLLGSSALVLAALPRTEVAR